MKRLLVATVLSALSLSTIAQEVVTDSIPETRTELDEVVLSNNILGSKFQVKNRTGSAYYLSPQDLQQFGYTDINKVLRAVPGVNVFEEDGFGLRPNISLRGTSPERSSKITIMEDGVLIAPAPYSAPAAYYFPTVGRIEAIEVLKGSSQIQYGPYTTGGAINLVSKQIPAEFGGDVRFTYGNYNSRNTEASIGNSTENFGFVTQYYNYNSDGFKNLDGGGNTGFDKNDYMGKFRINTDLDAKVFQALTFKIQYSEEISNETYLGLTQDDFDADPYRRYIASAADRMDTEHSQFQVSHLIKPASNIRINTTAYQNNFSRNWYKLNDVNITEGVSIANVMDHPSQYPDEYAAITGADTSDDVFGVKANNRMYEARGIQSVANITFGTNTLHDLELGIRYHEDSEDRFQWNDRYAIQNNEMIRTTVARKGSDANRISSAQALAAHVLYKAIFNKLTLTPGVRYENITLSNENFGRNDSARTGVDLTTASNTVNVFIPGIGANYRLSNDFSFFGGVHKGFAPPGSTEGTNPEESINLELGGRFSYRGITGEAVVFYNDYDNMLGSDLAASGGTGTLDQFNAGEALVKGLELILNYDVLRKNTESRFRLPLTFSYTHTDARFQSDFNSSVGIFGEVSTGDQIPYIAKNQFNFTASLEHSLFNISLSGRYTDEFRTMSGAGEIPQEYLVGSNFIVDLAARYFYTPRITFFTNVMNAFDTAYEVARLPAGLRPGAPFMINAGVGYKF